MPLFVFRCAEGHQTEQLAPRDRELIPCACGAVAVRQSVNHIGVSGFAATPRDQKNYRYEFKDFVEASHEVDYHYSRAESEGQPVKQPSYFSEGLKQARSQGAVIDA